MSIELYLAFLARELNTTVDCIRPELAPADEVRNLLWPYVGKFQKIAADADYSRLVEDEADAVLEALEANPTEWAECSQFIGRVLLDRTVYALLLIETNRRAERDLVCPPVGMHEDKRAIAVALFWLHRCKLPDDWRNLGAG